MTTSRSLVFSVFLSGLFFSTATLLLSTIGSRPVTIQIEEKPIFTGRVQDLAAPYLTVMTGLSLGVGVTAFALLGWQETSRRLNQATEQVSALKQRLQQQEGMVESLKFSEAKLQATGLNFFLDAVPTANASQATSLNHAPVSSALPAAHTSPVESTSSSHHPIHHNHAQTVGLPHPHLSQVSQNTSQIEELMSSMQQIMSQIEQLKVAQTADHKGSPKNSVDASIRA